MSDIYINTDLYKKDTEVYTSLEDINGYRVFSNEFYIKMIEKRSRERSSLDGHYYSIFNNESAESIYEPYMSIMRSPGRLIVRETMKEEVQGRDNSAFAFMAVGMIITTAILAVIGRLRRRRRS